MRNIVRTLAVLFAVSILGATMARADTLTYDFAANEAPFGNISFSLPAAPTPLSFTSTSFKVLVDSLKVDGNIVSEILSFYTSAQEGGVGGSGIHMDGPQLFTGSTAHPMFLTGNFTIGDDFNLSITPASVSTSAPEPYTLFLFGTGALGLYGLARRKFAGQESESEQTMSD
jgi:PEP-CTERM motif-containing protein